MAEGSPAVIDVLHEVDGDRLMAVVMHALTEIMDEEVSARSKHAKPRMRKAVPRGDGL